MFLHVSALLLQGKPSECYRGSHLNVTALPGGWEPSELQVFCMCLTASASSYSGTLLFYASRFPIAVIVASLVSAYKYSTFL